MKNESKNIIKKIIWIISAAQIFAIGALAVDLPAFLILPLFGITIEPIEYETPGPAPLPNIPLPGRK